MGWLLGTRAATCCPAFPEAIFDPIASPFTVIFLALPRGSAHRSVRSTPRNTSLTTTRMGDHCASSLTHTSVSLHSLGKMGVTIPILQLISQSPGGDTSPKAGKASSSRVLAQGLSGHSLTSSLLG